MLGRLLVIDQRPLLRECDLLLDAVAASSPNASEQEIDGCVGAVMGRLEEARTSGSPGAEVLSSRIRGQLEFGNTSAARGVIRTHVPGRSPSWAVLLPLVMGAAGLALGLFGPLFLQLSWTVRLFLLGLGAGGAVVVVTAGVALSRFRSRFPTAVVASDELSKLEQSLDDEQSEVAAVSFELLCELALEHPDEEELLAIVLMRAAAEVARATNVELDLADQALGSVEATVRSPAVSERGLYFAALALCGLSERLAVSRPARTEAAMGLLSEIAARRPVYRWLLASAHRRVERARLD